MSKKKISAKDYVKFWKNLHPGIRPFPCFLRFWEGKIKEILKKNKNPKALVLGVTPEIRDLLAKYKIRTVCLDNSHLMIKTMGYLIKTKNPKEKIIKGDWFKMPFKDNTFDFVISDAPQDNFPFSLWHKFFNNIFKVLKPNGYLMLGVISFKGYKQGISLKQYIKLYRHNPKLIKNQDWKIFYLIKVASHPYFYNKKKKMGDWIKVDQEFKKLWLRGKITEQEFNDLKTISDEMGISLLCQWPWRTLKEIVSIFKKNNFQVLGYCQDDVYPIGFFRQAFILKK